MPSLLELVAAQKMPRLSASDHVAQTLKKAIVDGLLPAGELLRQDEIAMRISTSARSRFAKHSSTSKPKAW
jgi:DNA-binding GntR family transcriptional regulator